MAIRRNLLFKQNEAISLVAMRSKELCIVQENYGTLKLDSGVVSSGIKTYCQSKIELRNLHILKDEVIPKHVYFVMMTSIVRLSSNRL